MSYLVRIGSTGNTLRIINSNNSSITSTISGTDSGVSWYLGGQDVKFQDQPATLLTPITNTFLTVLSSGQVSIGNIPSTIDPYKFSVSGNSCLTGNIYINGNVSANSLFFTSTTAVALSVTGQSMRIEGSLSITGDNLTPFSNNILEIYKGGTNSFPSLFVSSAGNTSVSGNLGITGNLTANDSIILPSILTGSTAGVIYKGTARFIHTFLPAANAGINPAGNNLFIGTNAGNFTMTAGAVTFYASYNTGIGAGSLQNLTNGYYNSAVGYNAGSSITTGGGNFCMGAFALGQNQTGNNNVSVGGESGLYCLGSNNSFIGAYAGRGNIGSSNSRNTFIGGNSGRAIGTGSDNLGIGYLCLSALSSGNSNIFIGNNLHTSTTAASNELNIGNLIFGKLIGTTSVGIAVSQTNISARLHLPAGGTSASSAPLKIMAGSLMTNREEGTNEYNGNFYDSKTGGIRYARTGGTLFDYYTSIGNSTTAEVDFYSSTISGNTLNIDGSKIKAEYAGQFAFGSSPRRLRVYFAGTLIYDSTEFISNENDWAIDLLGIRVSSTAIRFKVTLNSMTAAPVVTKYTLLALTSSLTGSNVLKITGQSTGIFMGANDVVATMGTVSYMAPA